MWTSAPSPVRRVQAGDSITYGLGSTSGDGWRVEADRLILTGTGRGVLALGASSTGSTSTFDRMSGGSGQETDEILAALQVDVPAYRPHLVRIMAGTNDSNHRQGNSGTPPTLQQSVANISSMLDLCRTYAAEVVLVCPLPPNVDANFDAAIQSQDAAILAMVAAHPYAAHVHLVNARAAITADAGWAAAYPDNTHPGDSAHAALAAAIGAACVAAL